MSRYKVLSLCCFTLIIIAEITFGIKYLLASSPLSYHLEVMSGWALASPHVQNMYMIVLKLAACGFLIIGISMGFMLYLSLKDGLKIIWMISTLAIVQFAFILVLMIHLKTNYLTQVPMYAPIGGIILSIIGLLFEAKEYSNS